MSHPLRLLPDLLRHRGLIAQFTLREIEGRYRGSYLGILWSFVTPVLMLAVYTFVFGIVFQARWPQAAEHDLLEFGLVLFAGLIAFNIFSESVLRAPGLIVGVPSYVKKVVFPLEILPVAVLGAALFHALVSLGILAVAGAVLLGHVPATIMLAPLAILPLAGITLGLSWFLASLGVFLRDIGNLVGVVVQLLIFACPVFYPAEAVPERFRFLVSLNPLGMCIDQFRGLVFFGTLPAWGPYAGALALGLGTMLLGHAWFMTTRKGFADVL